MLLGSGEVAGIEENVSQIALRSVSGWMIFPQSPFLDLYDVKEKLLCSLVLSHFLPVVSQEYPTG